MAFTLQQKVNISKGVALDTEVNFVEKLDASLKSYAGKIKKGDLLPTGIPGYATYGTTDAQLNEWCNRVLDGTGMTTRMIPSIISDVAFETNDITSSDVVIDTVNLWQIAAYAAKI